MSVDHEWTAAGLAERVLRLRDSLTQMERCHERGGVVPWRTFAADQKKHAGKVVELRAADFQSGTLRIKETCTLRLQESVQVNPNRPSASNHGPRGPNGSPEHGRLDWFPDLSDPRQREEYGAKDVASAYHLGFFASVAIEAEGVIFDLGGHTLEMHPEFALQQRFHALIELSDRPFITGEGPADFGRMLRSAKRVWVRNGTLGRSAHHGIHGNEVEDVLISDLVLRDYEVAAIALNGGQGIAIEDCRLEGSRADTPVLGTYSAGRFIARLARSLVRRLPVPVELSHELEELRVRVERLERALDATFARVMHGAESVPDPLFHNGSGLTDGNAYALVIHGRGAVVGGLIGAARAEHVDRARDVWIRGVTIQRTRGAIREIVAVAEPGEAPVQDPIGAVLPLWAHGAQLGNMDAQGRSCPTVLGAVQLQLATLLHALPPSVAARFASARIPPSIVEWSRNPRQRLVSRGDDPRRLVLLDDDEPSTSHADFEVRCNGDSMHHVNKGVIAVFIQAVDGLVLDEVEIHEVSNTGAPGSELAGSYTGPSDGGHAGQGHQLGYTGADVRGLYLGACNDASIRGLRVGGVESAHGSAHGIELAAASRRIALDGCEIGRVAAGTRRESSPESGSYPNRPARARGVVIDDPTASISLAGCVFEQPPTQPGPEPGRTMELSCRTAVVDLHPAPRPRDASSIPDEQRDADPFFAGRVYR